MSRAAARPLCLSPLDEAGAREILERQARAGKLVWPADIRAAALAVQLGKRAVLLGEGSVLYVERAAASGAALSWKGVRDVLRTKGNSNDHGH